MIWSILKHFKYTEAWGDPDQMNDALLLIIDMVRHRFPSNCYFNIHCAYETRSNPDSLHPLGLAIDFHISNMPLIQAANHLKDIIRTLGFEDILEIGIYPEWNQPGFHIGLQKDGGSWAQIAGKYVAFDLALEAA